VRLEYTIALSQINVTIDKTSATVSDYHVKQIKLQQKLYLYIYKNIRIVIIHICDSGNVPETTLDELNPTSSNEFVEHSMLQWRLLREENAI